MTGLGGEGEKGIWRAQFSGWRRARFGVKGADKLSFGFAWLQDACRTRPRKEVGRSHRPRTPENVVEAAFVKIGYLANLPHLWNNSDRCQGQNSTKSFLSLAAVVCSMWSGIPFAYCILAYAINYDQRPTWRSWTDLQLLFKVIT